MILFGWNELFSQLRVLQIVESQSRVLEATKQARIRTLVFTVAGIRRIQDQNIRASANPRRTFLFRWRFKMFQTFIEYLLT